MRHLIWLATATIVSTHSCGTATAGNVSRLTLQVPNVTIESDPVDPVSGYLDVVLALPEGEVLVSSIGVRPWTLSTNLISLLGA